MLTSRIRASAVRLTSRLDARRQHAADRREHDYAMSIPQVASEHASQIEHARSRGEATCDFCP